MRQIIYDLYKGTCAATGEKISLADAEVGHIVAQSKPEIFETLYPGLDVHNVINLHLIKRNVNRQNGNGVIPSPLALHNAISFSARIVDGRLKKILSKSKIQDDYEWVIDQLKTYNEPNPELLQIPSPKILIIEIANLNNINSLLSEKGLHAFVNFDATYWYCSNSNDILGMTGCCKFEDGLFSEGNQEILSERALAKIKQDKTTGTFIPKTDLRKFQKHTIAKIERMIDELGLKRPQLNSPSVTSLPRVK